MDGLATVAMGMCGPVQALKAEWPDGEVGVIISSRLQWASIQRGEERPLCRASLPVDVAAVSMPVKALRWDAVV